MHKRRNCRVAIFCWFLASSYAHGQGVQFIEPVAGFDLSLSQNQAVEALRSLPTTQNLRLIRVNPNVLRVSSQVSVPTGDRQLSISNMLKEFHADNNFSAKGQADDSLPGTTSIVVNGNAVTASIVAADGLYRIRPVGNGIHALFKVDASKFPVEHPPSFRRQNQNLKDVAPFRKKSETDMSVTEITVLVAYTPAVKAKNLDMKGLVDLAIAETNTSYQNSGVRIKLTAAQPDPVAVNYVEVGDHEADLAAFRTTHDKKMDEVHEIRERTKANIAVLLTDDGSYCGMASDILATTKERAFAVVYHDCATGYYSFAHEIGHLQGARHNPEADNSDSPFPYGHGFMDSARNRRTIMAYACPNGCPRMPQWARPTDWGNDQKSHDARVLNETALHIANFK